jgi:hypothetical protein
MYLSSVLPKVDLVSAYVSLAYRNQPFHMPGPHTLFAKERERASSDVKDCSSGWGKPPSTSLAQTSWCCAAWQVVLSLYVFIPVLQQRCEDVSHKALAGIFVLQGAMD